MHLAGLPWLLLASPKTGWLAVREPGSPLWPAFATQAALLMIGWLAAAKPLAELAETSGLQADAPGFRSAILHLLAILVITVLLALLVFALCRAVAAVVSYREALVWLAYGLTPLYLGRCLGLLSFAVFQPLARDPAEALALQVNPLGLSLAGLFAPLSLPWLLAAALDVFALWALVLLAIGAAHYLRLGTARALAALGALLLIWLLALTAAWQGLQRSL